MDSHHVSHETSWNIGHCAVYPHFKHIPVVNSAASARICITCSERSPHCSAEASPGSTFHVHTKKWCRKGPLRLLEDIICLVSLSSVMEKSTVGWSINLSWGACPVRMIWKSIYYWQKGGIMHQQSSPSMLIYQTPHQKPSFSIGWPFILGFFVGVVWHNIGYQGLLRGWKKTARWTSALIKSPRGIFGSCLSDHPGFVCLFCTSSKGWTCCGQLWNFRLLLPGPWKYCTFFIERTSKFPCFWRVHHENHFQQSST